MKTEITVSLFEREASAKQNVAWGQENFYVTALLNSLGFMCVEIFRSHTTLTIQNGCHCINNFPEEAMKSPEWAVARMRWLKRPVP